MKLQDIDDMVTTIVIAPEPPKKKVDTYRMPLRRDRHGSRRSYDRSGEPC